MLLQLIVSGMLLGGVYALTCMGLSLIFGVSKIVNFAHGDFVVIGMYAAFTFFTITGLNPYFTWILVLPVSALIGYLAFQLVKRTMGLASDVNQIFLTLAISMIIQNLILMIFKSDYKSIPTIFSKSLKIGEVYLSYENLVAFFIAISVTILFFWFLNKTDTGRAMKAVSQDRHAAALMGVQVNKIDLLVFCLGISMAGLAGCLLITMYSTWPTAGGVYNLLAWVVVVLGGLGSMGGALAAAFLIGISETLSGYFLGPDFRQVVYYVFFIFVLLVRPQGLFHGIKLNKIFNKRKADATV